MPEDGVDDQRTRNEPRARSGVRLFGIVGLVLCLVLAIGILIGRSWVAGQVDGVFDSVDQAVGRGTTIVAETTGRLEERVADLDTMLTDISAVPATASIVPAAIADRGAAHRRPVQPDPRRLGRDPRAHRRRARDARPGRSRPALRRPPDRARPRSSRPSTSGSRRSRRTSRGSAQASARGSRRSSTSAPTIRGAVGRVAEAGARVEAGLAAVQERIDRAASQRRDPHVAHDGGVAPARRLHRAPQLPADPGLRPAVGPWRPWRRSSSTTPPERCD